MGNGGSRFPMSLFKAHTRPGSGPTSPNLFEPELSQMRSSPSLEEPQGGEVRGSLLPHPGPLAKSLGETEVPCWQPQGWARGRSAAVPSWLMSRKEAAVRGGHSEGLQKPSLEDTGLGCCQDLWGSVGLLFATQWGVVFTGLQILPGGLGQLSKEVRSLVLGVFKSR